MVLAGQITRGQRLEILGRERERAVVGGWWLIVSMALDALDACAKTAMDLGVGFQYLYQVIRAPRTSSTTLVLRTINPPERLAAFTCK